MADDDSQVITLRRRTVVQVGIGILVIAALGVGVGIGMSVSSSPTAKANAAPADPTATSTIPSTAPTPNVVSACNADAKTVETAIAAYEAETGNDSPGAISTSGQGGGYLMGSYLLTWPDNDDYGISVAAGGQVQVTMASTGTVAYSGTACDGDGS
jgi:hypothetical protein